MYGCHCTATDRRISPNYANERNYRIYCISAILSQTIAIGLSGVSAVTLILISIDRLLAITMKTKYKTFVTFKRVTISLLMIWAMCFIIGTVLLIYGSLLAVFIAVTSIGCIVIIIIFTVNLKAFRSLRKVAIENNASQKTTQARRIHVNSFNKTLWTIILIVALFTVFFIPYIFSGIIYMLNPVVNSAKQNAVYNIGVFMMSLNSLANPVVYMWRMKKIRDAVKTSIKCCRRQNGSISDSVAA
jgi:adenosine receptor A2a